MSNRIHLIVAKRVLCCLKGTTDFSIFYGKNKVIDLIGFSNSDYADGLEDRNSTFGYVFMLNSGIISWSSKKQQIVILSTKEAEYIAVA